MLIGLMLRNRKESEVVINTQRRKPGIAKIARFRHKSETTFPNGFREQYLHLVPSAASYPLARLLPKEASNSRTTEMLLSPIV